MRLITNYEVLLEEADKQGLVTKEAKLTSGSGRINGNRIAIKKNITFKEKNCTLAEELGHHHATVGNILDQSSVSNVKQELKARAWAYTRAIALQDIISAYKKGCRTIAEISEFLNVTEEFFVEAIEYYRKKYGLYVKADNYIIYFEPLGVLEIYDNKEKKND